MAFIDGDKSVAEKLLPRISRSTSVTTTFQFGLYDAVLLVSLVHLAAFWGWEDVVVVLVSVYNCATTCKDSYGHVPLHYAAYNGHLEVVKWLTAQQPCNP